MDVIPVDNILLDDKSQNKVWSRVNDDTMLIFSVNCPFKSPYTSAAVQYVQTSCLKSGQRGVFIEACTLFFYL